MKLRSFFVLAVSTFAFASCGSTADTSSVALTNYQGEGFSMDVPKSWVEVEAKDLPEKPKLGKVVLALTSTEISSGFANSMLVLKGEWTELPEDPVLTKSEDYSIMTNSQAERHYQEYTRLETESVTLRDNDKTKLYVFETKYNTQTPVKKFMQLARVCNENSYFLVTIAFDSKDSTNKQDNYKNLVKSLTCTK